MDCSELSSFLKAFSRQHPPLGFSWVSWRFWLSFYQCNNFTLPWYKITSWLKLKAKMQKYTSSTSITNRGESRFDYHNGTKPHVDGKIWKVNNFKNEVSTDVWLHSTMGILMQLKVKTAMSFFVWRMASLGVLICPYPFTHLVAFGNPPFCILR